MWIQKGKNLEEPKAAAFGNILLDSGSRIRRGPMIRQSVLGLLALGLSACGTADSEFIPLKSLAERRGIGFGSFYQGVPPISTLSAFVPR